MLYASSIFFIFKIRGNSGGNACRRRKLSYSLVTACFDVVFRRIGCRIFIDQWLDHIHIGWCEFIDQRPCFRRCIPLGHTNKARTTVVFTRHVNSGPKPEGQGRHFGFGDFQCFHTVTHHRRGDVCCTVDFLGCFGSFGCQHRGVQTTVVKNRTDLVACTRCLPASTTYFWMSAKTGSRCQHRGTSTLCSHWPFRPLAARRFRTGPPDTDEVLPCCNGCSQLPEPQLGS